MDQDFYFLFGESFQWKEESTRLTTHQEGDPPKYLHSRGELQNYSYMTKYEYLLSKSVPYLSHLDFSLGCLGLGFLVGYFFPLLPFEAKRNRVETGLNFAINRPSCLQASSLLEVFSICLAERHPVPFQAAYLYFEFCESGMGI